MKLSGAARREALAAIAADPATPRGAATLLGEAFPELRGTIFSNGSWDAAAMFEGGLRGMLEEARRRGLATEDEIKEGLRLANKWRGEIPRPAEKLTLLESALESRQMLLADWLVEDPRVSRGAASLVLSSLRPEEHRPPLQLDKCLVQWADTHLDFAEVHPLAFFVVDALETPQADAEGFRMLLMEYMTREDFDPGVADWYVGAFGSRLRAAETLLGPGEIPWFVAAPDLKALAWLIRRQPLSSPQRREFVREALNLVSDEQVQLYRREEPDLEAPPSRAGGRRYPTRWGEAALSPREDFQRSLVRARVILCLLGVSGEEFAVACRELHTPDSCTRLKEWLFKAKGRPERRGECP
jgi:hypothetical protein